MPSPDPGTVAGYDAATWSREAYRGDVPQLTPRAVATGLVLGFVLSFANVYIGLKAGWFFSMALAACLAAFGAWRALAAVGLARPLSILETNCAQSTASSAAYATGNMVVGVAPALLLMSGVQPSGTALAIWIACIAALGVTLAIPLKRQLIDRERLAFPSGTAAAVMLYDLHERASGAAIRVRILVGALLAGGIVPVLRDLRGLAILPASSRIFDWIPLAAYRPSAAGLVLDHNLLFVGAGVFVGLRVAAWMTIGGLVTALVLGPHALAAGAATSPRLVFAEVGTWLGAPMLVAYSVVALASQWRAFAKTFVRRARTDTATIEIPIAWFWIGFAICGTCVVIAGHVLFGVPVLLGCLAVLASVVLGAVACRITGETDITPGGPIGKLTQLGFGALHPSVPSTNLLTASMTHASSIAAADLLNDLKSGYLLGADPRKQFFAQAIGIVAGTAASVLAYFLLVPDVSALVGVGDAAPAFAAPAAHQFRAIAEVAQHGIASLHPLNQTLVVAGASIGMILALAETALPRARRFIPSPAGLGLGVLLPASSSLSMLIGAALAAILARRGPDVQQRVVWPLAAGLVAGESLSGVLVTLASSLSS